MYINIVQKIHCVIYIKKLNPKLRYANYLIYPHENVVAHLRVMQDVNQILFGTSPCTAGHSAAPPALATLCQ